MIQLFNENNETLMARLPNESIDVICIDPPYLYLKGQKLERPFNEELFFSECKRLLTKDGFIVMFGRGVSFYRWNTILDGLSFTFKEEIIWNKSYSSSPLMALSRVHETISLFTKVNGVINKVKVPYLEMKKNDVTAICQDIKRMRAILKNPKSLIAVESYLETNNKYSDDHQKLSTTISGGVVKCQDRSASVMSIISEGLNEKTIIKEVRDHYSAIHPTQKPVRLIERILALVIPRSKSINQVVVADFFGGSFSTMQAVLNIGCKGISCEIDKQYFELGKKRIESLSDKLL